MCSRVISCCHLWHRLRFLSLNPPNIEVVGSEVIMDSAGRHHEETASHNDSYPPKLTAGGVSSQDQASQNMEQLAEDLRDCDWEQLEEKYAKAMEEHGATEDELRSQTAKLLEVK